MKYNKSKLTKLITILLVLAFSFSLASCENSGEESSESVSEQESQPEVVEFTTDMALVLLENDRTVTDIFLNNALCSRKLAKSVPVASASRYAQFAAVEELLSSTYTQSGGCIDQFLAYPSKDLPAVSDVYGTTYVFNHTGSSFDDFVNTSTVSVKNGETETEKIIRAQTYSGVSVEFKTVYNDGKWLLEKGIYALNPPVAEECTEQFIYSDMGSFDTFSGEVLVIELFVSDQTGDFEYGEETAYHNRIKTAMDYIIGESAAFGNEVNVTYESAYFQHGGVIGTKAIDFDIIFAETGFGSLRNFAEANYDLSLYDSYVFVVCLNKEADSSCAFYENTADTEIYFGERVFIGKETVSREICISLLRLLGAYGYNEGRCDEYTETLYREYFPNDIMVSESLTSSEMSPVTAYACGFTDELDPLYRVFFYE